jgi:hypothetical protein
MLCRKIFNEASKLSDRNRRDHMKRKCIQTKVLQREDRFDAIHNIANEELRYNLIINEDKKTYGLEVEMNFTSETGQANCEFEMFYDIASNEEYVSELLMKISDHCVTPATLRYILEDMQLI